MNHNPNEVLIFDCFGVLIDEPFPAWWDKYLTQDESRGLRETVSIDADAGRITQEELFSRIASRIDGMTADRVEEEWLEITAVNHEVVSLLMEYSKKYRLAILSNSFNPFVRRILEDNNLEKYFDEIIISSEVGVVKPGREIYELALSRLGVPAENSTMIDDNPKNIAAASSVGLKTLLYSSAEQLEEYLRRL